MVGGELGSGQPPLGSHLEFVSELVSGWFSFGYISPKFKVLCDPYSPGSTITKKGEKRTGRSRPAERDAASLSSGCDAMRPIPWAAFGGSKLYKGIEIPWGIA